MAFQDEIVKAQRKVAPLLRFAHALNPAGPWAGPEERWYGLGPNSTGPYPAKGDVLSFGTFSRSVANWVFSLEIPTLTISLKDPDYDWRQYANEPYDTLLRQWLHVLLRVHDDNDVPFDATVALGQIRKVRYPTGLRAVIDTMVTAPETLGGRVPRRVISLDDWPNAPAESVGRAVPIVYGRISNAAVGEQTLELTSVPTCCPEWVPPPGVQTRNPDIPALRWSDFWTNRQGTLAESEDHYFYGGPTDAWLVQNYTAIGDAQLVENANEAGTGPALYSTQGYGEITRSVGPLWFIGARTEDLSVNTSQSEFWDHPAPLGGRTPGQFGAAGMRRKMVSTAGYGEGPSGPQDEDYPVVLEVWHGTGAPSWIIGLLAWGGIVSGEGPARNLLLSLAGTPRRRNGAYIAWESGSISGGPGATTATDELDTDYDPPRMRAAEWTTAAMQNILLSNEWQTIEMKWKLSTVINPYGTGGSTDNGQIDTADVAADGYVVVRVDGQVVMYLQDIHFNMYSILPNEPHAAYMYWSGCAFRPQGYAHCLYLTDRGFCDEIQPVEIEQPVPCAENVVVGVNAGALPAILVESTETTETSLQRLSAGGATATTNDPPPTNVIGYTGVGFGGVIGPGDGTYYRISGVLNGVETGWSDVITCANAEIHYDRIEWDEPPQGPMDSYKIYQMRSPDLSFHPDIPGAPREETYWVTTVPGDQEPGGRDAETYGPSRHWVEFSNQGEGTPYNAAQSITNVSYDNVYVVAGHACDRASGDLGVLDVFVPLPGLREKLGGLNLLTGEKEPITFEETAPRLTRLVPGTDYWTEVIDKPSGIFTVIHVTRRLRDINTCAYPPVSVNLAGITHNADGSGGLLVDGPQIVKHFLLNWVFNNYTNQAQWFTDVTDAPGLIDGASFDIASDYAANVLGVRYLGAVAILSQADVRQLISEAISSFGLSLFYKNASSTGWGAWSVKLIDTRQWDSVAAYPYFTPADDLLEETFESEITTDLLANVVNYKAGPNLSGGSVSGWLITGQLTDDNSRAKKWGDAAKDLLLPWTRDQATAVHVAGRYLDLFAWPVAIGAFKVKGRGVLLQPADMIRLAHPDAPGLGWSTRAAMVMGHDLDLDTGRTTIRFLSSPSMID